MKSLDDLYKIINPIDDDLSLYCHLATCKSLVFVKEINDEKQRIAINKEIASTEKNDT